MVSGERAFLGSTEQLQFVHEANGPGVRRRPQKYQETWRVVPGVRTRRLLYVTLLPICNCLLDDRCHGVNGDATMSAVSGLQPNRK